MSYDPFVIIGVDRNASQQEILEAYKAKRQELQEKRFLPGEEGADAARALTLLDDAYQKAMELKEQDNPIADDQDNYKLINEAIKNNDLERAQRFLDSMSYRDGNWHFYQARVYYARRWYQECKKQLEVAMEIEPDNARFKSVYEKVCQKMNPPQQQSTQQRTYEGNTTTHQEGRSYGRRNDADDNVGGTICSVCATLWCLDSCCECMGGDLIKCC